MSIIFKKRLKLDKFIYGSEQRIFKTTGQLTHEYIKSGEFDKQYSFQQFDDTPLSGLSLNIYYYPSGVTTDDESVTTGIVNANLEKYVLYGEYSTQAIVDTELKNQKILINNLRGFSHPRGNYVTHSENKFKNASNLLYNNAGNTAFSTLAEKNEYDEPSGAGEIIYNLNNENMPIDIAYSSNNAYFLMPLDTHRYTEIMQNKSFKDLKRYSYDADFKPNYKKMLNRELDRTIIDYVEDNGVPLYDLNFNFIQSIDFKTKEHLTEFAEYLVSTVSKAESTTSILNKFSIDKTRFLLNDYITSLTSSATIDHDSILNVIISGMSNVDPYTITQHLSPKIRIDKLSNTLIDNITTNCYLDEYFHNCIPNKSIKTMLLHKNEYCTNDSILPQNVILNCDTRQPIRVNNNLQNFYNIFYLKNNRDPHYNINYDISDISQRDLSSADYFISAWYDNTYRTQGPLNTLLRFPFGRVLIDTKLQYLISSTFSGDRNNDYNDLFDMDITHSLESEYHNIFKDLVVNEETYRKYLSIASVYDATSAIDNHNYATNWPTRLSQKTSHYLNTWDAQHISTNKIYSAGELLGIRSYLNIGHLTNSDKMWFSYRYCNRNTSDYAEEVLNDLQQYSFIERLKGVFKYQQLNMHKSNIYSIQITNSGLNPAMDPENFSLEKTLNYVSQQYPDIVYTGENNQKEILWDGTRHILDEVFVTTYLGWKQTGDDSYVNESLLVSRRNMRKVFEEAIRISMKRYMPGDTSLWKIIYEGR